MASEATTAEDRALDALTELIKSATTPELLEAQSIILRRLALQGDVVGSRAPGPRNITEIGGYLNLLAVLDQPEMRAQVLSGILGVSGPNPPLGWLRTRPPLAMATLPNDRPSVPEQATIPLAYSLRSDFSSAFQQGLKDFHDKGCTLPLFTPLIRLPQAEPGAQPPEDPLPYLGRVVYLLPSMALRDPATDPLALVRPQGTTGPYQPCARVISPGAIAVAPASCDVLTCDQTSCSPVAVNNAQYVDVGPLLALAGFYRPSSPPQPASSTSLDWARFSNATGLVAGMTTLGGELSLLHDSATVAASVFAGRLHWRWNGAAFAAP